MKPHSQKPVDYSYRAPFAPLYVLALQQTICIAPLTDLSGSRRDIISSLPQNARRKQVSAYSGPAASCLPIKSLRRHAQTAVWPVWEIERMRFPPPCGVKTFLHPPQPISQFCMHAEQSPFPV